MSEQTGPARVAREAMAAVEASRRDDWLAHFADDAMVEDPVGRLPDFRRRCQP